MPNQSSTQRKQAASSQTGPTAPTQPEQERSKYVIWTHAHAGVIKLEEKLYTPEELEAAVCEIVAKGVSQQTSTTRMVFFPAVSLEKIEVIKQ